MEGGAAAGGASEGGAAAGGASEGGAAAGGASEGGAAAGGASVFIRCPNNTRIETITPVTTKKCMPHPGFLEHPRLSPGVVTGSRARFLDFYFRDPTPTTCQEEA